MIIRSLELSDFRNYESLALSPDPGVNIFYGDNAQGKTNLLEAIFLSCTTKSHKGAKDKDIIRFGKKEAHIRTSADVNGRVMRVDMHLRAAKSKGVALDGIKMRRASDFLRKLDARIIFFSPEDLAIIKGGPSGRRHFLDMELCQFDPNYMDALSIYQKAMTQRGNVLRDAREKRDIGDLAPLLDVYDKTLAESGKDIIRARKRFIEEMAPVMQQTHGALTAEKEQLTLAYEPDCEANALEEELRRNRNKDIQTAQTNAGPHRDDMKFLIRGKGKEQIDIRHFGSQGQQRTAALSLKLSEIELVKTKQSMLPVMLLDDVLSELDDHRQQQLLASLGGIQTLVTCTGLDDFVGKRLSIDKIFHVTDGSVTAEN
ncbi:MAG: DNA replication/repair protein RecF [Lachnospiraceae bacterium]|nr:DNA replication/repair protein RecF [Lachnospiraceae bacterium]